MIFKDRNEAGKLLAQKLLKFKNDSPIILALPRGGLPIGYEIAKALKAPLDILFVRKIGAPFNPELAIGAVVDGKEPTVILNQDLISELHVKDDYIDQEKAKQLAEIERRKKIYHTISHESTNQTAIIVDDGIATGSTMFVAIQALKQKKFKKLVVAVPVASDSSIKNLEQEVDEVYCLLQETFFYAVGAYYESFQQLTDKDVLEILESSKNLG